jgi:hypothetical protein
LKWPKQADNKATTAIGRRQPVDGVVLRAGSRSDEKRKSTITAPKAAAHLNDADEIGTSDMKSATTEKRNDKDRSARHRIAADDHRDAEDSIKAQNQNERDMDELRNTGRGSSPVHLNRIAFSSHSTRRRRESLTDPEAL